MKLKTILMILSMGVLTCAQSNAAWPWEKKAEVSKPAPEKKDKGASVINGMTEEEVIKTLGEPKGYIGGSKRKTLMYDGVQILLVNGRVAELPDNIEGKLAEGKAERAYIEKQKKKGLVLHDGIWMKPSEKERIKKASSPNQKQVRSYVMLDKNNKPIDHRRYLHRGQITVVDFYADWCGPCRALDPELNKLVRSHSGVALRKVNIGNWGSSVADTYNVTSVPNVRVFDRKGNMMGAPTSSLGRIDSYIRSAKKNP